MGLTRRSGHTLLACVLLAALATPTPAWSRAQGALDTVPARSAAAPTAVPYDANPAVAEVQRALDAAEDSATSASRRALDASASAERARVLSEQTRARAEALTAQSAAADAELVSTSARVGASAAVLYRSTTGGPLVARVLASADPDSLLLRLDLLERITEASAREAGEARSSADVAASLRTQAEQARVDADRQAAEAATTAASARAEADGETAAVAAAQEQLDDLFARLAALRETTVAQERAARLAAQTAVQAAEPGGATGGPARPAPGGSTTGAGASGSGSNGSGSSGSGPGGSASNGASAGGSGSAGGASSGAGSTGGSGSSGGSATAPPTGGSGGGGASAPAGPVMTPAQAQSHARGAIGAYGWGDDQFSCLVSLWNRESGWRVEALNPYSGAYGIPQALPGEKMASAGPDWRTNGATQIAWGLSYISSRYGSPCGAWAHSEKTGWY